MSTTRRPAEVFAPGVFVREEMEERGWSQTDLSEILDRPVGLVNELLSGKRSISPETARGLAAAFGTSPELWMNLEASYQLSKVRNDFAGEISLRAQMYEKAPIKEMIRRGWIEPSESVKVLEQRILRFYRIDSLEQEPRPFAHAARKSTPYRQDTTPTQLAWLYRAWHISKMLTVQAFSIKQIDDVVGRLAMLRHHPMEVRHVSKIMSEAGIRFVIVAPLSKSKIDGACFWIDDRPTIAMSIRFDRIDYFWFVLMHELGHLAKGEQSVDEDVRPDANDSNKPDYEIEADRFAINHLVDQERLSGFIARVGPLYSAKRIEAFARTINVHPGIVVGQLQHRQEVSYASFRKTLVPIREVVTSSAVTDGWGFTLPADL